MDEQKKLVILSGAGISAESGLKTFRGGDGLWENHRIEDVASPKGWRSNRELVLHFYDERRRQVLDAEPNAAHTALAKLESHFDVHIVTQNIDDLHERGGSAKVLHLHGEILKARSTLNESYIIDLQGDTIPIGMKCPQGGQMRPHIVWFGEPVPLLETAAHIVGAADILIVVGTSLNVYPAASLINFMPESCAVIAVDPNEIPLPAHVEHLQAKASVGIPLLAQRLVDELGA